MTLKPSNRLIGTPGEKGGGRKPRNRRDRNSRRGKSSTLAVKAFDSIEEAIGGRDAVVGALAAGDLTEDQSYLFGLIADPRNDTRSLASICAKANYTLGQLLQLFKDAKLARAQIEAIVRATEGIPQVAEDTVKLAQIREESCLSCEGTGKIKTEIEADDDNEASSLETPCDSCFGKGTHTHLPSVERQKLALEIGGLYHRAGGVQIANVFPSAPVPNELGGRITPDYLRDMRMGTDRLLYPGRSAGVDTSEVVDAELVEAKAQHKSEVAQNQEGEAVAVVPEMKSEAPGESKTNEDADYVPVPSVDPGTRTTPTAQPMQPTSPFLAPTGVRPKELE